MLGETLNQGPLFLVFLGLGIVLGLIFYVLFVLIKKLDVKTSDEDLLNHIIKKKIKLNQKQKLKRFIFNFLTVVLLVFGFVCFFTLSYCLNFGKPRLFCVVAYCLGYAISIFIGARIKKLIFRYKLKKSPA